MADSLEKPSDVVEASFENLLIVVERTIIIVTKVAHTTGYERHFKLFCLKKREEN